MATQEKETKKPESKIWEIKCPDCDCEYFIPMMKAMFSKSFAGNRIQMEWPSRDSGGDHMVAGCPACQIMYRVKQDGTYEKLPHRWEKAK